MQEFILDVNVATMPDNANYPHYLMNDLRSAKKVALVVGGTL